jgi:hypothetical protein
MRLEARSEIKALFFLLLSFLPSISSGGPEYLHYHSFFDFPARIEDRRHQQERMRYDFKSDCSSLDGPSCLLGHKGHSEGNGFVTQANQGTDLSSCMFELVRLSGCRSQRRTFCRRHAWSCVGRERRLCSACASQRKVQGLGSSAREGRGQGPRSGSSAIMVVKKLMRCVTCPASH